MISAQGDGSGLTALDASALASGTVPDARMSANVPLLSGGRLSSSLLPADVPLLASGKLPDSVLPSDLVRAPSGAGSSASLPAPSCKAIKTASPAARSGVYWLKVAGAQTFLARCDMEDGGGGWTLLYAGRNGNPRVRFDQLAGDLTADCVHPQFDCARRLATDRSETNTEFASACGDAMVAFTLSQTSVKLLRDGVMTPNTSGGYQPIGNLVVLYGSLPSTPDTFYSGTSNPGWILLSVGSGSVFSSGYAGGYDGCNSVDDRGALTTLYWREVP